MNGQFGNDQVFLKLKTLYDSDEKEQFARLLCEKTEPVITMQLKKSVFSIYTEQDKEDAAQDALLYVLEKIGDFLNNPANDPALAGENQFSEVQKQGWLHKTVFNGLRHSLNRVKNSYYTPGNEEKSLQRIHSLDMTVPDSDLSMYNEIPSGALGPEEAFLLREQVEEACTAFFSLKNSPSLLACIGLVILTENLDNDSFSLADYVNIMNGKKLEDIIQLLEEVLFRHKISQNVLDPLKNRINDEMSHQKIDSLTEKNIANRKNSMLSMLRKRERKKED